MISKIIILSVICVFIQEINTFAINSINNENVEDNFEIFNNYLKLLIGNTNRQFNDKDISFKVRVTTEELRVQCEQLKESVTKLLQDVIDGFDRNKLISIASAGVKRFHESMNSSVTETFLEITDQINSALQSGLNVKECYEQNVRLLYSLKLNATIYHYNGCIHIKLKDVIAGIEPYLKILADLRINVERIPYTVDECLTSIDFPYCMDYLANLIPYVDTVYTNLVNNYVSVIQEEVKEFPDAVDICTDESKLMISATQIQIKTNILQCIEDATP